MRYNRIVQACLVFMLRVLSMGTMVRGLTFQARRLRWFKKTFFCRSLLRRRQHTDSEDEKHGSGGGFNGDCRTVRCTSWLEPM